MLTEFGGTIIWFDLDADSGVLSEAGTVRATLKPIPPGGEAWSAHIAVHPSGKFLYVSNRIEGTERGTENSLGVFSLAADGKPTAVPDGYVTDGVNTPRDFGLDPSGHFLVSVNQEGDCSVLVFRIDQETGRTVTTRSRPQRRAARTLNGLAACERFREFVPVACKKAVPHQQVRMGRHGHDKQTRHAVWRCGRGRFIRSSAAACEP